MTEEERLEGFALLYAGALLAGDAEGVARCLEAACHDPELDRIVENVNRVTYEEEFGLPYEPEAVGRLVLRWEEGTGDLTVRMFVVHEGGAEGPGGDLGEGPGGGPRGGGPPG